MLAGISLFIVIIIFLFFTSAAATGWYTAVLPVWNVCYICLYARFKTESITRSHSNIWYCNIPYSNAGA